MLDSDLSLDSVICFLNNWGQACKWFKVAVIFPSNDNENDGDDDKIGNIDLCNNDMTIMMLGVVMMIMMM